MHLSRCALYFAALIFCASPALSAVTVEAVRVGSAYSGPSNQTLFDATLKTTSTTPGVPAKYVSRSVAVGSASAVRLARGALGGPLGLAVTAAMIGHGLLIDNDTGEILSEPGGVYTGQYVWNSGSGGDGTLYSSPETACQAMVARQSDGSNYYISYEGVARSPSDGSSAWRCRWTRTYTSGPNNGLVVEYSGVITRSNTPPGGLVTPPVVATDADIAESVPDELLRDLINDLIERRPASIPTVLPELASEMDATRDAQEAAESHSSDPATNPAPTPEQQEIVDNQTTTEPTFAAEWPAFCSWATIVCDFIDWMRAEPELPEHPPIPLLDIDIDDYDSALPATASCPAPVTVTTDMWGSFELSYQPFCDLAAYIRLALLGIAYLYAAYIVIGVRR